jgi:hypothetical protein
MNAVGYQLAKDYAKGHLCGWAGRDNPDLVREQFNLLSGSFRPFSIAEQTRETAGRKMFLYQLCRKALGKDTDNYPQEIGDCVSFGAKNATEHLTCSEMVGAAVQAVGHDGAKAIEDYLAAARIKFRPVFPPYYYGTGRMYIGRGQLGSEDGSMGSWMAEAVQKYGTLFSDEPNVPKYAGRIAKQFGTSKQPLDQWQPTAKSYLVKSAALINSWDELVAAICNGYSVTTASNIGYSMEPSSDGFHRQTANWGHQMCIAGVDETYSEPYGLILNSWGDVHGHLKDFQNSSESLPVGVLRVRRADIEKHIRAGETFAFSQFDGFPEQGLDKALFMLV